VRRVDKLMTAEDRFFPRLNEITLDAVAIERLETTLPEVSRRWPTLDAMRSPRAVPPAAPGRPALTPGR